MVLELPRHRFTSAEYQKMGEAGIFTEDDRVELLDGEIVEMSPIGNRHVACVDRLNDLLSQVARRRAIVRVQNPTGLGEYSIPQPDLSLLRRQEDFYATTGSTAADLLLVVEVADSSVSYDRAKWPLYARAGVAEAWLADLTREVLEVHRDPAGDRYRTVQLLRRGDRVSPLAFPEETIAVDEILG